MHDTEFSKVEVAVRAGTSVDTVSRAIRSGELPAVREPHRVLIKSADCERWIGSRRQPAAPPKERA